MKKGKIIASSLLSIVMCSSLIAGATYALFTDTSTVNIAVTSGKVDVEAYAQNLSGHTTIVSEEEKEENYKDLGNFSGYYETEDLSATTGKDGVPTVVFANGGKATLTDGTVTLDRITPGDSVEFDIAIENRSNVATQYRTSMTAVTKNEDKTNARSLMSALNLTITRTDTNTTSYKLADDRTTFDAMESYVSGWKSWDAATNGKDEYKVHVVLSLPLETMNEYQNLATEITFKIEAVQGNAHTTGTDDIFRAYNVGSAEELGSILESANASDNSVNIDLTQDINLTTPLTISGSNTSANKTTVINLNNKTLTSSYTAATSTDSTATNGTISVDSGANVVIENGTLVQEVKNTTKKKYEGKPDESIIEVINADTDIISNVTIKEVEINSNVDTEDNFTSAIYVQGSTTKPDNADKAYSTVNVDIQDITMTINNSGNYNQIMTQGIWAAGYSTVNISGDNTKITVNGATAFVDINEYSTVNFSGGTIDINEMGSAFAFDESTLNSDDNAILNVTGGTINLLGEYESNAEEDEEEGAFSTGIMATQDTNICNINGLEINCSAPKSKTVAILSCGQTNIDDITINITGDCTAGAVALFSFGGGDYNNFLINGGKYNINATTGKAYFLGIDISKTTDETNADYVIYNGNANGGNGDPMVTIKKDVLEAVQKIVDVYNNSVNNWNISFYDFWLLNVDV